MFLILTPPPRHRVTASPCHRVTTASPPSHYHQRLAANSSEVVSSRLQTPVPLKLIDSATNGSAVVSSRLQTPVSLKLIDSATNSSAVVSGRLQTPVSLKLIDSVTSSSAVVSSRLQTSTPNPSSSKVTILQLRNFVMQNHFRKFAKVIFDQKSRNKS